MSIHIVGTHDQNTLDQIQNVSKHAARSAVMADGHLGYWMPIGGVAAFRNLISPVGVGFDIACGNCAIKTDMKRDDLKGSESRIADDIVSHLSFGIGRSNLANDAPTDHPLFDSARWSMLPKEAKVHSLKQKARAQLGTVGSGNHYIDIFYDENDDVWVGVHFGSRGFGHNLCSGFMAIASNETWGTRVKEDQVGGALMKLDSPEGQAYWELMQLAGEYAYAGREWATRKVVSILGTKEVEMVHNHHNFAWAEKQWMDDTQQAEDVIVIRKGATPAFPGQKGFVGGSMGDNSVILEGASRSMVPGWDTEFDHSDANQDPSKMMFSTVHGAGRVMGRMQAKGKQDKKTGEWKREPRVTQVMMDEWVRRAGIQLRGSDRDESPHVYRRLPEVLAEQGDTINILHTLTPVIVCMAGDDVFDPYKD